jgi:hypothetical protein
MSIGEIIVYGWIFCPPAIFALLIILTEMGEIL